jgi:peptidoglycan/xylan/chitin deacetylase (PgdA/CDA1 family)
MKINPTLIYEEDSLENWSIASGGTVSTGVVPDGSGRTLVQVEQSGNANTFWDLVESVSMAGKAGIEFEIFLEKLDIPGTSSDEFGGTVTLADSAVTNTFAAVLSLKPGWNHVRLSRADFAVGGGSPSWESTSFARIRFKLNQYGTTKTKVWMGNVAYAGYRRPKIAIMFDDGYASLMSKILPIMEPLGLLGSVAVIQDKVGTNGFASQANLHTLHDAGWAMVNHTKSHQQNVLKSASVADCYAEIASCRDYLAGQGWTRDDEHLMFCSPYGEYSLNYVQAAVEAECKMFRGLFGTNTTTPSVPSNGTRMMDNIMFSCFQVQSATSTANILSWVRQVISAGRTGILLFHDVVDSSATGVSCLTSDFTTVMNAIARYKALCDFVTLPQLRNTLEDAA